VNYAAGLAASGFQVFIETHFVNKPAKCFDKFEATTPEAEKPIYFLIGFLSGKDWWFKFLAASEALMAVASRSSKSSASTTRPIPRHRSR
jgi:hypothetical protein